MSPDETDRRYHSEGMWLWRANKVEFITSETAIEIVRRVIRDRNGQDEVDRNEPLTVQDDCDTWLVWNCNFIGDKLRTGMDGTD